MRPVRRGLGAFAGRDQSNVLHTATRLRIFSGAASRFNIAVRWSCDSQPTLFNIVRVLQGCAHSTYMPYVLPSVLSTFPPAELEKGVRVMSGFVHLRRSWLSFISGPLQLCRAVLHAAIFLGPTTDGVSCCKVGTLAWGCRDVVVAGEQGNKEGKAASA